MSRSLKALTLAITAGQASRGPSIATQSSMARLVDTGASRMPYVWCCSLPLWLRPWTSPISNSRGLGLRRWFARVGSLPLVTLDLAKDLVDPSPRALLGEADLVDMRTPHSDFAVFRKGVVDCLVVGALGVHNLVPARVVRLAAHVSTTTIPIVSICPRIGTTPASTFCSLRLRPTIGGESISRMARRAESLASRSTALLWGFVPCPLTRLRSTRPALFLSRTRSLHRSGFWTGSFSLVNQSRFGQTCSAW